MNTHTFDGKLQSIPKTNYNESEMNIMFANLIKTINEHKLESRIKESSIRAIELIMNDKAGNFDMSNNNYADHILARIIVKLPSSDVIEVLCEQMSDIVLSGSCPQGRAHRLYQVYLAL